MSGPEEWPTFFWYVLRASWHGSIVIGLVLIVQGCLGRHIKPAWRYRLWYLALIRLAIPFSFESPVSIFNLESKRPLSNIFQGFDRGGGMPAGTQVASSESSGMPQSPLDPQGSSVHRRARTLEGSAKEDSSQFQRSSYAMLILLLPIIWILGALFVTGRIIWTGLKAASAVHKRRPVSDLALLKLLEECRKMAGLRHPPWLIEAQEVSCPALYGFSVPYLLLPPGLTRTFNQTELRFIFLHELTHLRRRDVLRNLLITILLVIHWFNPLVWLCYKRLRSDRELACDAAVLSLLTEAESRHYGQTVIKLLENYAASPIQPGLIGVLEDRNQMKRRIAMIACHARPAWPSTLAAATGLVALAATVLTDAQIRMPSKQAVTSEFSPQSRLSIRILEANSGRPLSGASLNGRFTTGHDGRALVPLSVPTTVLARARDFVPRRARIDTADEITGEYVLRLDRAQIVAGLILDEHGSPIPGVEVRALVQMSANSGALETIGGPSSGFSFTTDGAGRWECAEIPATWKGISFTLIHPDYVEDVYTAGVLSEPYDRTRESPRLIPSSQLASRSFVMHMRKGLPLRGGVYDRSGKPIPNASVREGWGFLYGPHERMMTDPHGRFSFNNVYSGRITLTAQAEGFAPKTSLVAVRIGMAEVNFYLANGNSLRGRVVTEEGQPISGATVAVTGTPPEFEWNTKTDRDGRFSWASAPSKAIQLIVMAPTFVPDSRFWLQPDNSDHLIVLQQERRISGIVIDAETGQLVPVFKVYVGVAEFPNGSAEYRLASTSKDGQFSIRYPRVHRPIEVRLLPASTESKESIKLKIEAEGYLTATSVTSLSPHGATPIKFALFKRRGPASFP